MKTRGIIGKRIVAIRQTRFWNDHLGQMDLNIEEIELGDGTLLRPIVGETDSEYAVDMVVVKPPKELEVPPVGEAATRSTRCEECDACQEWLLAPDQAPPCTGDE